MSTYVMSDLHGQYKLYKRMLKQIDFNSKDVLYILGDVCDRGEQAFLIYKHIMKNDNIHLLMGNHEKMFLEYLEIEEIKEKEAQFFEAYKEGYIKNGGELTIEGFKKLKADDQENIRLFIANLPKYKIIDKYILVHAGIFAGHYKDGEDINMFMENQKEKNLLWIREDFLYYSAIPGYVVVFGHTITDSLIEQNQGRNKILIAEDKIAIDCGAYGHGENGQLGCLRLDDLQTYYQYE